MEEMFLGTLAAEALKPVSSIIDAALRPKLDRMRINAKRRELKERLEDKIVNEHLEQYFKRLLRRVSGITTIVFPQQQLPLISIYEPMKLEQVYFNGFMVGAGDGVSLNAGDLKSGENYIIVDSAGMGKSTFVKYLVLDIFQSSIKIPIYLELRRLEESETLLGKLSKEIDEHQENIDERFLGMLFEQGNYVIILDGYDELSENAREKIGEQITELAIKYDQNSIILTSRPEVNLPPISKSTVFGIQSLEREQAESLVLRYDAVANIDVGKGLISQFGNVSFDFLKNPLLIILLYRTYGYNQSISTKVTSFYDDIYNAFYKGHDLSKSGFSRPKMSGLEFEEFRVLLRGFAFLLSTQQISNIASKADAYSLVERSIKLTSTKPISAAAFFNDLLLIVPLLIKEGNEFRFIHRSINEFFTAEFLAYTQGADEIIRKILSSNILPSFKKSFEFLSELNPSLFRKSIVAPIATQILEEKKPVPDPVLRTIRFFFDLSIGVITDKEDGDRVDFHKVIGFARMIRPHLGFALFPLFSRDLSFKIVQSSRQFEMPWAAWKLISKDFPYLPEVVPSEDVKTFWKEIFEPDVLYPLNSDVILNNADHPFVKSMFHLLLYYVTPQGERSQTRIIDIESCKMVLETIREERETQDWINKLIDG